MESWPAEAVERVAALAAENRSILLDLKIIARTALLGFKDPNAY